MTFCKNGRSEYHQTYHPNRYLGNACYGDFGTGGVCVWGECVGRKISMNPKKVDKGDEMFCGT